MFLFLSVNITECKTEFPMTGLTHLAKISENIKNGPKNLKNVSPENLGKNKELPALGKSQRSS